MKRLLVAALFGWLTIGFAGSYYINVTREGDNLYRVTDEDMIVVTEACGHWGYGVDAYLKMDGQSSYINFLEGRTSCDVRGVYGDIGMKKGSYPVKVQREDFNWYRIRGTGNYIKTIYCSVFGVTGNGTLQIDVENSVMYLSNGGYCTVQKVYGLLDL